MQFVGTLSSLYISIIAVNVVDLMRFGTGIFSDRLTSISIAFVLIALFSIPGTSLYVRYHIERSTVQKYISVIDDNVEKWIYRPIFATVLVPLLSVLFLILGAEEEIRRVIFGQDLNLTALAMKSWALLILPCMMPLTYVIVKYSRQRAKY